MTLEFKGSTGEASRNAPYERVVFYEDTNDLGYWRYDVNTGRNQTQFSYVEDEIDNIGIDLQIPLTISDTEVELKFGSELKENYREAEVRSFRFLAEGGPIPTEGLDNRIDYIFADKNFDPSRLIVIENTAASSPAG